MIREINNSIHQDDNTIRSFASHENTKKSLVSSGIKSNNRGMENDSLNFQNNLQAKNLAPDVFLSHTIVTNLATINLVMHSAGDVSIRLYNISGIILWTHDEIQKEAGMHVIQCPTASLLAGEYIITTEIGSSVFTHRIIKR